MKISRADQVSFFVFFIPAYLVFRVCRLVVTGVEPAGPTVAWFAASSALAVAVGAAVRWKAGPIVAREPTPEQAQEEAYSRQTRKVYLAAIIPLLLIAGGLVLLVAWLA